VAQIVIVTTSYPRRQGDAEGHFVAAEARRLCAQGSVTVLVPGTRREALWGERVVGLPGGEAFGFPGALAKLREQPLRAFAASRFVASAIGWLRARSPERVLAHFLLPCGFPIATRGLRGRTAELELVVHGSDARLFARLPFGRDEVARELLDAGARLRFVSSELRELVLRSLSPDLRHRLAERVRVEPSPIDIEAAPERAEARRLLGIDVEVKLAVVVARLVAGKRVEVALEACRRVGELQSYVIGDGPERARLQQQFPEAHFVGQVERPHALAYIAAADALVSASLDEGAPSVVREARALGTPVVCLAAGDLRKWAESDPGLNVVA
jgi:teichuronic acid biosynthesis glycosyltransferase TuaC